MTVVTGMGDGSFSGKGGKSVYCINACRLLDWGEPIYVVSRRFKGKKE